MAADQRVVIVGGGFSGTMLAAELARKGVRSTVIDAGRAGKGTAFSTPEEAHLLNVPAGRMGGWADQPGDFARAVAGEGFDAQDFVPRRRFGEYVSSILDEAKASGLVQVVVGDAIAARQGGTGWTVELAGGSRVEGQALVLAQGNQPPQQLPFARGVDEKYFLNDPWSEEGRAAIVRAAASGGDVLLIGTGLTMVDVVLSLDEARLRGRITALSRRGLAPRAHADHGSAPVELDEIPHGSVRKLWDWLLHRGASVGWRAAIDAIRPHSQALWQALTTAEQARFLRHIRPWWDVHRHRIAPEVAGRIKRLVQLGQLEIVAGRVTDMWIKDGKLEVSIKRRGRRDTVDHDFALAVNCTGPLGEISRTRDPLLKGLFEAGLARPDALDLGLDVDGRSRISAAPNAWALGPLTKGRYWEITAVPDIRGQVAAVADDIVKELGDAVQS
ncbi:FAD/NAD(P)-binding protein [Sphingomonas sp. RB56-2]|uniref:FAD/NAD(P)-binding protein n=1 Tax=Sphingomonas brevis TaxID=2908206 RepID=A0ABT0S644_9SPHN|nr:FAD-dependent oxidoreductase [Sphingomonas brevis]MCL6739855.1 FAD/NAD(P)-binding protein [Sphingomonas brevis]